MPLFFSIATSPSGKSVPTMPTRRGSTKHAPASEAKTAEPPRM